MRLRVNSLTGRTFRRNGIAFTGAPVVIDTAELGWTAAQVAELHATAAGPGAALHVEDIDKPAEEPVAAPAPTTPRSRGR